MEAIDNRDGIKMRWEFKPGDILQFVLLLIALTAFAYNGHFRVSQIEREVETLKRELAAVRKEYVQEVVYDRDISHIMQTLQEIKAAVIR